MSLKKNVLRLLQAFVNARTECKLVVVGKNGWLFEEEEKFFENHRFSKRIVRIPYSDFLSIINLLKGARALVFPSLYEGFGLPVLEAMQIGTPVICSNAGSLPEVGGNAAHYIDPYSIHDITASIEKFSSKDDDDLNKMRLLGLDQAKKFSKDEYKNRLSSGYKKVFKRGVYTYISCEKLHGQNHKSIKMA